MPFAQFGTDPQHVFDVWNEYRSIPTSFRRGRTTVKVASSIVDWRKNEDGRLATGFRCRERFTRSILTCSWSACSMRRSTPIRSGSTGLTWTSGPEVSPSDPATRGRSSPGVKSSA